MSGEAKEEQDMCKEGHIFSFRTSTSPLPPYPRYIQAIIQYVLLG